MENIREVLNEYLDKEVEYTLLTEEGDIVCDEEAEYLGKNIRDASPEIYLRMNEEKGVFRERIEERTVWLPTRNPNTAV